MANGCGTSFMPDPFTAGSVEYWDNLERGRIANTNYLIGQINEFPKQPVGDPRDLRLRPGEQTFVDTMRTLEGFRSSFGRCLAVDWPPVQA
jgi:hypothetical protein